MSASAAATPGGLAFMLGEWASEGPEGRVVERWSQADDGAMVGHSETVRDGEVAFFEELRIELHGDTAVLLARPMGREPAIEFRRSDDGRVANTASFDNPAHDFPKRIVYRKQGDRLEASIEGDGERRGWTYLRVRP